MPSRECDHTWAVWRLRPRLLIIEVCFGVAVAKRIEQQRNVIVLIRVVDGKLNPNNSVERCLIHRWKMLRDQEINSVPSRQSHLSSCPSTSGLAIARTMRRF